jgi:signal transduction histidine kinase
MPVETRRHERARFLLIYAAAWLPVAAAYTGLLVSQGYDSPGAATADALFTVLAAAVPGLGVWWLTARLRWPPRSSAAFLAAHALLAALYATFWVGMTYLRVSSGGNEASGAAFVRNTAGFQLLSGVWLYGVMAGIFYAVRAEQRAGERERAAALADARRAEAEAERARADALRAGAELRALRARLNPHFLFNTLHSLTVLVRRDPDAAEEALERLGALLRYVLDEDGSDGGDDDVTLEAELRFVRDYLALEAIRLGPRLRVEEAIDAEALSCRLPALTLQPLVENAVRHAVNPRPEGGTVRIAVERRDGTVTVRVSDDGPGAPAASGGNTLRLDGQRASGGVGLRTVEQRLRVRFPEETGFSVDTGVGFAVTFSFPALSD